VDLVERARTLAGYKALLARLHGFYRPFEPRLEAVSGIDSLGLDLPMRRKVPLIEADLAHLGLSAHAIAALPGCGELLPRPTSTAQALGCLYVVEGATLGGAVIRRHVEASLGLKGPAGGVAFFSSGGADIGRRWQGFRAVVERVVTTREEEAEAVAMAVATFCAFERWVAPADTAPPTRTEPGGS
jgi:heme oxygenase